MFFNHTWWLDLTWYWGPSQVKLTWLDSIDLIKTESIELVQFWLYLWIDWSARDSIHDSFDSVLTRIMTQLTQSYQSIESTHESSHELTNRIRSVFIKSIVLSYESSQLKVSSQKTHLEALALTSSKIRKPKTNFNSINKETRQS